MSNYSLNKTWIQTFTGRRFYPLDPKPEDVDIKDIAHALSNMCRFTGHCYPFYSVAEHCIRASLIVPHEWRLEALLHDAAEAYVSDLSRPLKYCEELAGYKKVEKNIQETVAKKFLLKQDLGLIKEADWVMLATERRDLFDTVLPEQTTMLEDEKTSLLPLPNRIFPFSAKIAKTVFLNTFDYLYEARLKETACEPIEQQK